MGIQNPKKLYRKFSVVPMCFSKWHIEWQTCKRDCTPHIMNIRMKIYSSYSSLKLHNEKYLFSLEKHINSFHSLFFGKSRFTFCFKYSNWNKGIWDICMYYFGTYILWACLHSAHWNMVLISIQHKSPAVTYSKHVSAGT